jgi:hypothetical protein
MEDDESFEDHLKRCQSIGVPRLTEWDKISRLTIEFGSRKRGERALQTSWIAPSSEYVAAMMGSMYCLPAKVKGGHESVAKASGGAYLCFRGSRFWLASILDDLFE